MTPAEVRRRFATARVARLATVRSSGAPHLVPVTFALDGDRIVSAIDAKPKRTRRLARLDNIAHEPRACLLVDGWSEDWSQLWWARADGTASVCDIDERAVRLLQARYPQYADEPPAGPVVVVEVEHWSGWSAGSTGA